jgi:tryptophan synthase beta subunit
MADHPDRPGTSLPRDTTAQLAALAEPSAGGRFGAYGGQYVAETLMPAVTELEAAWRAARIDPTFWAEVDDLLVRYVGRPSLLYRADRLSADVGCRVYRKRGTSAAGST